MQLCPVTIIIFKGITILLPVMIDTEIAYEMALPLPG